MKLFGYDLAGVEKPGAIDVNGALSARPTAWAAMGLSRLDRTGAIVAARVTCNFSRRTAAYLTAGRTINHGTSAVAVSPGVTTIPGGRKAA